MSQEYNINQIKNDVDNVVIIMKDNLNKVLERDEKIGNIYEKTENLENDAKRFEKKTKKLKCQMFMEHLKSRFVLVSIVFIIIFILVIVLAIKTK
jgi:t-SNARE complex subunit (syntaxin)